MSMNIKEIIYIYVCVCVCVILKVFLVNIWMRIERKCGWWLKSNNNHNDNDIGEVVGSEKQLGAIVQEHALGRCYPLCYIFIL